LFKAGQALIYPPGLNMAADGDGLASTR